jgi:hypothetical protein
MACGYFASVGNLRYLYTPLGIGSVFGVPDVILIMYYGFEKFRIDSGGFNM